MGVLSIEKFSVETNMRGTPLIALGKRYTRGHTGQPLSASGSPGIALLMAHGTGFHKEIWEPTIEALFIADQRGLVREAWAVDCQNHGESAIANETKLYEHPNLIGMFPSNDRVVIIAHSAGAVAGVLVTSFFNPPNRIPFSSIILVEPPIFAKDMYELHKTPMYTAVAAMTPLRRDVWASSKAAKEWLLKRPPWSSWSAEALDKYVTYGLRELPTVYHPNKQGVTLSCTKEDEARAYTSGDEDFDALWRLNQICPKLPVHIIWGEVNDLFSKELKDSIADPAQGRIFVSVSCVAESGHMIPQERPKLLAQSIVTIIQDAADSSYKL
ncbi:alpha/beta-hydrolase [Mycena galericulata]|nr:alpha/beta-hydrolase [Mycena galericulata]